MSIFEYNEEAVLAVRAKDAFEDGHEKGLQEGLEKGREEERKNTEAECARADAAEKKLAEANKELAEALAMIEKLKAGK